LTDFHENEHFWRPIFLFFAFFDFQIRYTRTANPRLYYSPSEKGFKAGPLVTPRSRKTSLRRGFSSAAFSLCHGSLRVRHRKYFISRGQEVTIYSNHAEAGVNERLITGPKSGPNEPSTATEPLYMCNSGSLKGPKKDEKLIAKMKGKTPGRWSMRWDFQAVGRK
jgi:hypothetical protein